MRSEHLEYFVAISETGSINKASTILHTSPQNVSKILRQLEEELGTVLVLRKPRGVVLTPAGKEVLQIAAETIEHFAAFKKKHKRAHSSLAEVEGEIFLYCVPILNMYFMDDFLQSFQMAFPGIHVSIVNTNRQEIFKHLEKQPDCSVAVMQFLQEDGCLNLPPQYRETYQFEMVHQDKIVILVSKKSTWSKQHMISVKQLLQEPLIFTPQAADEHSLVMAFLSKYGDTKQLDFMTRNPYNFFDYVLKGERMAVQSIELFMHNTTTNREKFHIIELAEEAVFQTDLVCGQEELLSPALQYFMDYARAFYAE